LTEIFKGAIFIENKNIFHPDSVSEYGIRAVSGRKTARRHPRFYSGKYRNNLRKSSPEYI